MLYNCDGDIFYMAAAADDDYESHDQSNNGGNMDTSQ